MRGLDEIKAMNARASVKVADESKRTDLEEACGRAIEEPVKNTRDEKRLKVIRYCAKYDGPKYLRHEIQDYTKAILDLQEQIEKYKHEIEMREQVLRENGMNISDDIRFTAFD